jgi:putative DNA primase/helicase
VYLYPTDAAWDREKRARVPLSALRHAIADCFDDWIKHPGRAELDIENLVFDPTQQVDLDTHINTFRGLPLSPRRDDSRCVWQLALLDHLCNGEAAVVEWLVRWLAYPLQHVGAKMASAVLMHSSQQGSGKSLFWEEVIKPMYGEYGSTLGQHQLESQYTAWRSQLLFALFEEVLSRDQKYSHTGTLKHMITGKTQRIEQKFLTGWEESNHMNSVFLSNELQPWPLEPSDRRMLVVWPEKKLPDGLKANVLAELANGGREALLAYLLAVDTSGFSTHSEPPVTDAKQRIIDFGRPGWEVFFIEWRDGYLDAPFMPCLAEDLFALYRSWADKRRENVVSITKFGGFVGVQDGIKRRRDVHYSDGYRSRKGTFFIPRAPADPWRPREGESQQAWLGRCAVEFAKLAKGDA